MGAGSAGIHTEFASGYQKTQSAGCAALRHSLCGTFGITKEVLLIERAGLSPWIVVGFHSVCGPAANWVWRERPCSRSGSLEPLVALLRGPVHENSCRRSGTIRKGVYSVLLLWGWHWSDCLRAGHPKYV